MSTILKPVPTLAGLQAQSADYQRMEKALAWLAERWRERPSLDEAAEAVGLSPFHFQRVFTRWAGVSPKTFMAALAHDEARRLLIEEDASVLDAALDTGLSGPSRLHDLFIAQEGVTPGDARRRGEGLELTFGWAPTPFGKGLFVLAPRGLAGLSFADEGQEETAFAEAHARFPAARWVRDDTVAAEAALGAFTGAPTPLVLIGPPFHVQVWKALLRIPRGETASYADVAAWAGKPGAFRATGAAIGANPLGFLIPCHRAIAKDGRLHGYHWGLGRKAAMLGMEAVEAARAA
ncbi:methylated-DNA--[protein]-cysteine S-methyltransferase [Caulobacter sp. KR2-114]|uniref:methylated-DNA--[protein]-cysteine S-methyltransferase n=1 Tax=Caulobacter sp. KR2-114 TaxID=3400912 RepID=UPI003C014F39